MIDKPSGHHARFLRAPGLRLDGVRVDVLALAGKSAKTIRYKDRAYFLHVLEGALVVSRENGFRLPLGAGDSLGIEKGTEFGLEAISGDDARLFISSIPRQLAFIANLPDDVIPVFRHDHAEDAEAIGQAVLACVREMERADRDDAILRRYCEVIMLQLIRIVQSGITGLGSAPVSIRYDENILRAWSAYFSKPDLEWTADKLAEAAGLSRSAFFERFKAVFGASPHSTLMQIRLAHAKRLLGHSKAAMPEIALAVGYNSEHAFIRAFKREFGITPGQWRESVFALSSGFTKEDGNSPA